MKRKNDFQMEVQDATKMLRTAIRLKHSLAADVEINERVPQLVLDMNAAALRGQPFKPNFAELLA